MKASIKDISIYNKDGFTLVEVLVAISLLLLGLVGPMAFLIRVGNATEVANQRTQATFLAQEGVELVQKVRDDAWVTWFEGVFTQPNPWPQITDEFENCNNPGEGCAIWINNSDQVEVERCIDTNDCRLRFNSSSGNRLKYSYGSTGGSLTPFTRRVFVADDGDELSIRSVVTWRAGSLIATQRVESITRLINIYDDI